MNTADQTALLIATSFQRSSQNRARLSIKSFQRLAGRQRCGSAFLVEVMHNIAEYGVIMVELETGGFGLLYSRALCGAKSLSASNFLSEEEIDSPDAVKLRNELLYERPDFDNEE